MATVVTTHFGDRQFNATVSGIYTPETGNTVFSTRTGLLVCRSHNAAWCDCIAYIVKMMADAPSIFDDFFRHEVYELMVPLLPSDFFFFAHVKLDAFTGSNQVLKTNLFMRGSKKSTANLGLISQGDGRLQLRKMILDWLGPNLAESLPINCTSWKHGYKEQEALRAQFNKGDKKAIIAQHWSAYWYEKCATCLMREGVSTKFDSDLIPER